MKRAVLCMAVLVAAVAVACAPALAQYRAPVVLAVEGDAQVMKKGSAEWKAGIVGMAVAEGDAIRTGESGSVTIGSALGRKNLVTVDPASDCVISSGNNIFAVNLSKGEVTVLMTTLPKDSTFEVRTPAAVVGAIGTGWSVWTDGQKTIARSHENTIYVKGIGPDGAPMEENFYVDSDYQTIVNKGDAPATVERLAPDSVARWNAWRDKVRAAFLSDTRRQIDAEELAAQEASRAR